MHDILLQAGLAFVEGLGLVFSPCILPVLPLILAGGASGDRRKPFGIIIGFILSFTVLALLSRHIFSAAGLRQDIVQKVSFGLLALLGLVMLLPRLEEGFARMARGLAAGAQGVRTGEGFGGGLVMGCLIGVVWTPCAGPVLAAALLQVVRARTDFEAVAVVVSFTLGAAIPMTVIALFGKALAQKVGGHAVALRRALGAVLVAFAGLGLFGINIGALAPQEDLAPLAAKPGEVVEGLPVSYPAPEVRGVARWINTRPLTREDLRGKVVLYDFWTYSCINCIRTLPHLREWYARYHDLGLEIVGIHAPEFDFERRAENVMAAVARYDIRWPVAMDNDYATWDAFRNRYWPAHYLADRQGNIVYTHFGEGNYNVTEHNIRALLGLEKAEGLDAGAATTAPGQTPETYLGVLRAAREWEGAEEDMPLHGWKLSGGWLRGEEKIVSVADGDTLTLRFYGGRVFLVMATSGAPVEAEIVLDPPGNAAADVKDGRVRVDAARHYELVSLPETAEGVLRITARGAGLEAYAFTFGRGGL